MLKTLLACLIEDLIRWISGPLGIGLRRVYYRFRFKECGDGLVVETGAQIIGPEWISVGDTVWIDRQVILIGGPPDEGTNYSEVTNHKIQVSRGEIAIGSNAHIGIGTIIQGHGGVQIGDGFTSSPHTKIYSLSNDQRNCRNGTVRTNKIDPFYILSPVFIGSNVWIGLNAVIVGHSLGDDVFVKPNSVVAANIEHNSIVCGAPAAVTDQRFFEPASCQPANS